MDRPVTLIVILMFTAIVGIGIGNILMGFAGMVTRLKTFRGHWLGIIWLIVLLVSFLDMFWSSSLLTKRDAWKIGTFLYVVSGPIILLFASSVIGSLLQEDLDKEPRSKEQVEFVLTRFFFLYALSHVWRVGLYYMLGLEWSYLTAITVLIALASASLVVIKENTLRWGFTITVALLVFGDIVAQTIV